MVPGASAVVEERSACRLADLDAGDAAQVAVLRALPPRLPVASPCGDLGAGEGGPAARHAAPLILFPRAAASLLAALAPQILAGELGRGRRAPRM